MKNHGQVTSSTNEVAPNESTSIILWLLVYYGFEGILFCFLRLFFILCWLVELYIRQC